MRQKNMHFMSIGFLNDAIVQKKKAFVEAVDALSYYLQAT